MPRDANRGGTRFLTLARAIFFSAATGAGAALGVDATGGETDAFAVTRADGGESADGDDGASTIAAGIGAAAGADAAGGETVAFAAATADGDGLEVGDGDARRGCASGDGTKLGATARLAGGSPVAAGASAKAAMPAGAIVVELGFDSLSLVPARGTSAATDLGARSCPPDARFTWAGRVACGRLS